MSTCATCKHIGVSYWDNGYTISHHCMKERERRAESMPAGADLLAHFRAFFDASADQRACRHYEERPPASPEVMALLNSMGEKGSVELQFWSAESSLASSLDGKFVKSKHFDTAPRGYRTYTILPVGRREREREGATP